MADKMICDVRMENADNGVIINYTEKVKRATKGSYDDYAYNYKREVYDFDDDEGEDFQEAFDRFKELFAQARKDSKNKKPGT